MGTRHRIPTIFNLSMVDVLCCALGCVILLWLLNLRDAKQRADAASLTDQLLGRTRSRLTEFEQRAATTEELLRQTTDDRDRLARRADDLQKSLAAVRDQLTGAEDRLAKKTKEQEDVARELAAARQRVAALDVLVREKEDSARAAARTTADLEKQLDDLDARLKVEHTQAEMLPGLRAEAEAARDKLAAAEAEVAGLQKELGARRQDLAGAGRTLGNLEESNRRLERDVAALRDEKRALADQAARARAAAENRFAGINLTGRRVVFLIDMSGSMEMVDENTAAPQKWAEVRQSLTQIMRSLPELEKFQVILFATQTRYLLGNEGRWLDYDPLTSPGRVAETLALVKPKGNTDMYAAFEAAFPFRRDGLDTIYLFSDGLPNIGAGLSPEAARTMKETERSEILSKYVRTRLRTDWNRPVAGKPRVRINAVGFFYESPDVGAFLWALARENDGSFVGMSKP
jgi:predicted  nucleic acid-binding Zn-ribbon protein